MMIVVRLSSTTGTRYYALDGESMMLELGLGEVFTPGCNSQNNPAPILQYVRRARGKI